MTTFELSDETRALLQDQVTKPVLLSFLNRLPTKLKNINSKAACRDFGQVMKEAHDLQGSANIFGYFNIGKAASDLEQDAKLNNFQNVANDMLRLEQLVSFALKQIEELNS